MFKEISCKENHHTMSSIGGKNYKKIKKAPKDDGAARYIVSKKDFAESIYAKVSSMLGSGRLLALGEDNHVYNCVIRGRLYKKVWIKKDDLIIIDPRGFEKSAKAGAQKTADVLHKLTDSEINASDVHVIFSELEHANNRRADPLDDFEFDRGTQDEFGFDDL